MTEKKESGCKKIVVICYPPDPRGQRGGHGVPTPLPVLPAEGNIKFSPVSAIRHGFCSPLGNLKKKKFKPDGVGPLDNRPSTDYLHHFVQDKRKL